MEIDRIQPVKGLKVERTGSEQERRKRPQTEEDFSDILDSTMAEENPEDSDEQQPSSRQRPQDTVSLAASTPPTPVVSDLVSISSAAKVGSEMHNASRSVEDGDSPASGPDTYTHEQVILPVNPAHKLIEQQPDPPEEEEDSTVNIDTLA